MCLQDNPKLFLFDNSKLQPDLKLIAKHVDCIGSSMPTDCFFCFFFSISNKFKNEFNQNIFSVRKIIISLTPGLFGKLASFVVVLLVFYGLLILCLQA